MAKSTDIKNAIKTKLDELVTATTISEVQMDDFKVSLFDRDIGAYPCAILVSPAIEGTILTNSQNLRTHTFNVVVIQKYENISSATDIETLVEAMLDKFDNDPTLGGVADGGVEPSSSIPESVVSKGQTLIVFSISIKAKAVKDLTF